jgi:hypothetical protein
MSFCVKATPKHHPPNSSFRRVAAIAVLRPDILRTQSCHTPFKRAQDWGQILPTICGLLLLICCTAAYLWAQSFPEYLPTWKDSRPGFCL